MSVTPITHKSPARRDADMVRIAECIERERQRIGDEKMLDMLNADGFLPRKERAVAGKPKLRVVGPDERPKQMMWNTASESWG